MRASIICSLFLVNYILIVASVFASPLLVYYPSTITPKKREKILKDNLEMEVLVFAKQNDFEKELQAQSADIVIAPSSFSEFNTNYESILGFKRDGKDLFKYLILSMDIKWKNKDLSEARVGVVQFENRDQLKKYISKVAGKELKKIKSVSRPEDLLPLMVFQSVDVIMIAPDNYEELKFQYTAQIYKVGESLEVKYPMVFIKKGISASSVVEKFKKISNESIQQLGMSSF